MCTSIDKKNTCFKIKRVQESKISVKLEGTGKRKDNKQEIRGRQTGWWKCLSDGITYPLRGLVFLISKNWVPVWLYLSAVKELRQVCMTNLGILVFLFFQCDSYISKCTAATNVLLNPMSSLPFTNLNLFVGEKSDTEILITHYDEHKYPQ